MKKFRVVGLFAVLAALLITTAVAAQGVVTYDDTGGNFASPSGEDTLGSYVRNGDFNAWNNAVPDDCGVNYGPDHWCFWYQSKAGWEDAHIANSNLAFPYQDHETAGDSYGLGLFTRHAGSGTGSYYAGVWQQLDVPSEGYYFINVSEAIWWNDDRGTTAYNSIAWYAIADSMDPFSSSDWRELDPYTYQCPNSYEVCNYAGRDETVWVEPGQYLHLIVGQKFPVFNASTVFLLDDVSLVSANPNGANAGDANGYYDWYDDVLSSEAYDDKCHWLDEACLGFATVVVWDEDAPR